ncbi:MAG: DUF5317 domain-containing protein [Chloroflexi bacterium]|nr:DUF5317 domain-containing protein [Chloroflexota bacterium]
MLVSGVALGLFAGVAFGGDIRRLARLELRWTPVLFGALAIRLVGLFVPFSLWLYVAALLATAAAAALNRHLPGALLIAAGSLLNAVVVVLNGGMPIDPRAAEAASLTYPTDGLHVPLGARALLPFLTDVIPVPIVRGVYSVGDVLIAIGGFWLPFAWLRRT